jgi:hypothetical protein
MLNNTEENSTDITRIHLYYIREMLGIISGGGDM